MGKHRKLSWLILPVLFSLLAACASPNAASISKNSVATLQQQVNSQSTRIVELEGQVTEGQATIVGQQTQIAAASSLRKPTIILPTAGITSTLSVTNLPQAELVIDGNTRGLDTAQVTITVYLDYF
jgi:hypothetical protein